MNIKRWWLHRKWLVRYQLAYERVIRNEDLYPNFYEHDIDYWVKRELRDMKRFKTKRYESKV